VFDWLFEGRSAVYLALAVAAGLLLALWVRDRRRHWLLGVGFVGVLALLYLLLDRVVETNREQVVRKVKEMAEAVKTRDTGRLFAHISDQFRRGSLNKSAFRQAVEGAFNQRQVESVTVWEFDFPEGTSGEGGRLPVVFQAKPHGGPADGAFFRFQAEFVRDPDGQWRLQGFQFFYPTSNQPLQIPGVD
jgi:hypothetical protein